jgi:hypothetical protein
MIRRGRGEQEPIPQDTLPDAQPLQQEAWKAALDLYRDENCRYFRVADILPIYGCLCDYALGRGMDVRAQRVAERHLAVLTETARRVEVDAKSELPEAWSRVKQALAQAIQVFRKITASQRPARH